MGVTGPFNRLRQVAGGFRAMTGPGFKRGLSSVLGAAAVDLVVKCFDTSTDPHGHRWKPVKRGGKPLIKTGRLRASITFRSNALGFAVLTVVFYAGFQNRGTRTINARRFIPEGPRLPVRWRARMLSDANDYVRRNGP